MIQYKCKCGEVLIVKENTEASRKAKVTFKLLHRTRYGCYLNMVEVHNPGHGYTRTIARREA